MKKPTDRLAALDTAIEAERRTIERLQANCQRTREEVRKAEETQGEIAYKALAEGEAQAQAALTEAEELLSKSQARAKSSEIALAAAMDKLEALRKDRDEAFRQVKRQEYAAQAVLLLRDDSTKLETALAAMTEARAQIQQRLQKMELIGSQAGIDTIRVHTRIKETLRHIIEQRGQFASVWMSRETKQQFKGPIADVLHTTLAQLIPELEEGERKAS